MVVKSDVSELFDENIEGFMLAACNDADTAGLYNGWQPERKDYSDKILKLREPYQYFQAGTILFNLSEFRKNYTIEEILAFASNEKWFLQDQDVLNKLCEGRVKYIDMAWNVMVDYNGVRVREIVALAPHWLNRMYMEARKNPKIIHYAGPQKPWREAEMDFATDFWKYARLTPFYEIMLWRMCQESRPSRKSPFRIAIKGLRCIREHGFIYTMRKIKHKILGEGQ